MKDPSDLSWGEVAARMTASLISSLFGALYGSFLGLQQTGRFSGSFPDFLTEVINVFF